MGEGFPARVVGNRPAAIGLRLLTLDVSGTPLVGTHERPGQYVELSLPGHAQMPFALASAPDPHGARWEVLVKAGPPLADALSTVNGGAVVEVTRPVGPGFPLERAKGHSLVLVATGSGISPIRSVLQALLREREAYGKVTLLFGARTPKSFAFAEEVPVWEANGVRVVRVVSQPDANGWAHATGYVQKHLGGPHADAVAFLCGQKAMIDEVALELERQGVPSRNVYLNY
jgi:NAD(P)H-flavin reductase